MRSNDQRIPINRRYHYGEREGFVASGQEYKTYKNVSKDQHQIFKQINFYKHEKASNGRMERHD